MPRARARSRTVRAAVSSNIRDWLHYRRRVVCSLFYSLRFGFVACVGGGGSCAALRYAFLCLCAVPFRKMILHFYVRRLPAHITCSCHADLAARGSASARDARPPAPPGAGGGGRRGAAPGAHRVPTHIQHDTDSRSLRPGSGFMRRHTRHHSPRPRESPNAVGSGGHDETRGAGIRAMRNADAQLTSPHIYPMHGPRSHAWALARPVGNRLAATKWRRTRTLRASTCRN